MRPIAATAVALGKLAPGAGNIGLREQEVMSPEADDVLLEVIGCGICGTDLHIADDEFPSTPPVTMGHEVTGEVVAVGPDADPSLLGGRFACETYYSYCERCDYCRSGRPNLCVERRSIGSHVDGGFTRWMIVPARNVHPVPNHVGRFAGALLEPLACVANCLFDPPVIGAGDRVLVVGPGAVGILTAQAARAAGGQVTIVGLDRDRRRLDIAGELGLTPMTVEAMQRTVGAFDVVCECSGSVGGAALALDAVGRRGRYVQIGIFGKPVTLDLDVVLYKEVRSSSGSASTPRSWQRALALVAQDLVRLDPLVSHVVPLAEWERAFEATRRAEGLKHVIDPQADEGTGS